MPSSPASHGSRQHKVPTECSVLLRAIRRHTGELAFLCPTCDSTCCTSFPADEEMYWLLQQIHSLRLLFDIALVAKLLPPAICDWVRADRNALHLNKTCIFSASETRVQHAGPMGAYRRSGCSCGFSMHSSPHEWHLGQILSCPLLWRSCDCVHSHSHIQLCIQAAVAQQLASCKRPLCLHMLRGATYLPYCKLLVANPGSSFTSQRPFTMQDSH